MQGVSLRISITQKTRVPLLFFFSCCASTVQLFAQKSEVIASTLINYFSFLQENSTFRYSSSSICAIELSIRQHILTTLTLCRRTNATHLVTVNVNDLAIVRADNRRDPEKGNYRGIEKVRREAGEARRQVVS